MMNKLWYLIKYDLTKRIKTKAFVIGNLFLFLVILVVGNIPTIIQHFGGDFEDDITVAVYDETSFTYDYLTNDDFTSNFNLTDQKIIYTKVSTADALDEKALLENYDYVIDSALDSNNILKATVYSNEEILIEKTTLTKTLEGIKNAEIQKTFTAEQLEALGKLSDNSSIVFKTANLEVQNNTSTILGVLALILIIPIFIFLTMIMQYVGIEIITEKSTRCIEIIISNVTPLVHFLSKIISALAYAIIEGIIMIASGAIAMAVMLGVTKQNSLQNAITSGIGDAGISNALSGVIDKLPMLILFLALFVIAGFLFYMILMAVISSLCNNNEDLEHFQGPLMLLLLAGFYIGIFGLQFSGSNFVAIAGYIPFFSPLLATSLYMTGAYSIGQVLLSFGILVIFDVLAFYFGMPMYREAILSNSDKKFGQRIKEAFKFSRTK